MRKTGNPLGAGARLLARGAARVIGVGANAVRSSTRGLQELYAEAREEYEADRASMRTVGSRLSPEQPNLAVPGSISEQIQPQIITTGPGARRKSAGRVGKRAASAPAVILGPDGTPVKRKPGRPRKNPIIEEPAGETRPRRTSGRATSKGAAAKPGRSSRLADDKPAGRASITVEQGTATGTPSRRGRKPRDADESAASPRKSTERKSSSARSAGPSAGRTRRGGKRGSESDGPAPVTDSSSFIGSTPDSGGAGSTDVPPTSGSTTGSETPGA